MGLDFECKFVFIRTATMFIIEVYQASDVPIQLVDSKSVPWRCSSRTRWWGRKRMRSLPWCQGSVCLNGSNFLTELPLRTSNFHNHSRRHFLLLGSDLKRHSLLRRRHCQRHSQCLCDVKVWFRLRREHRFAPTYSSVFPWYHREIEIWSRGSEKNQRNINAGSWHSKLFLSSLNP